MRSSNEIPYIPPTMQMLFAAIFVPVGSFEFVTHQLCVTRPIHTVIDTCLHRGKKKKKKEKKHQPRAKKTGSREKEGEEKPQIKAHTLVCKCPYLLQSRGVLLSKARPQMRPEVVGTIT